MTTPDALTLRLLGSGTFVRDAAPHRLVRVDGADAADFLQRLCTQDVLALPAFGAAPAAFLDGKGKLLITCFVARMAGGFLLESQAHQHERLLQLLERYHFTEQLQFAPVAGTCREAIAAAAAGTADGAAVALLPGDVIALTATRRGVRFQRWHAPSAAAIAAALPGLAGQRLDDDLAECLRMGAGFVKLGVDSEPGTLALEADLDDHCSLTKGCYTGQEIVARIHTYGHTNRRLCLLHLAAGPAIAAPATLHEPVEQIAVGRVMHAVPAPGGDLRVGLGYLPKDFQALGTRLCLADGSAVTVAGFAI